MRVLGVDPGLTRCGLGVVEPALQLHERVGRHVGLQQLRLGVLLTTVEVDHGTTTR